MKSLASDEPENYVESVNNRGEKEEKINLSAKRLEASTSRAFPNRFAIWEQQNFHFGHSRMLENGIDLFGARGYGTLASIELSSYDNTKFASL